MKRILILTIFIILSCCSFANAQRSSRLFSPCPNTTQKAEIKIKDGNVYLIPCPTKAVIADEIDLGNIASGMTPNAISRYNTVGTLEDSYLSDDTGLTRSTFAQDLYVVGDTNLQEAVINQHTNYGLTINANNTSNKYSLRINDIGSSNTGIFMSSHTSAEAGSLKIGNVQASGGSNGGTPFSFVSTKGLVFQNTGVTPLTPHAFYFTQSGGSPTRDLLKLKAASDTTTGKILTLWNSSNNEMFAVDKDGKISLDATNTASGTTGNQTINKPAGTVNFAASTQSLTVTNSLVSANSIVLCVVRTNDTTAKNCAAIPSAGSVELRLNANSTAETSVGFVVIN